MEPARLKKLEENAAELAKWKEALKRAAPWPEAAEAIVDHILALAADRLRIAGFSEDEIADLAAEAHAARVKRFLEIQEK